MTRRSLTTPDILDVKKTTSCEGWRDPPAFLSLMSLAGLTVFILTRQSILEVEVIELARLIRQLVAVTPLVLPAFILRQANTKYRVFFVGSNLPLLITLVRSVTEETTRVKFTIPRKSLGIHVANFHSFIRYNLDYFARVDI